MVEEQEIVDGNEIQVNVISFANEDGSETFYAVTTTVEHEDKTFALLAEIVLVDDLVVPVDTPDVFIAKLVVDENGVEMYLDPTDEEFQAIAEIAGEFQE